MLKLFNLGHEIPDLSKDHLVSKFIESEGIRFFLVFTRYTVGPNPNKVVKDNKKGVKRTIVQLYKWEDNNTSLFALGDLMAEAILIEKLEKFEINQFLNRKSNDFMPLECFVNDNRELVMVYKTIDIPNINNIIKKQVVVFNQFEWTVAKKYIEKELQKELNWAQNQLKNKRDVN